MHLSEEKLSRYRYHANYAVLDLSHGERYYINHIGRMFKYNASVTISNFVDFVYVLRAQCIIRYHFITKNYLIDVLERWNTRQEIIDMAVKIFDIDLGPHYRKKSWNLAVQMEIVDLFEKGLCNIVIMGDPSDFNEADKMFGYYRHCLWVSKQPD